MMLPRERFMAALDLKQPDRVPHFEQAYNEASIIGIAKHFTDRVPAVKSAADMSPEELMMTSDALALFIEELDIDGVFSRSFERGEELGGGCFKDDWGIAFKRNPHGLGFPMEGPIGSLSDLKNYRRKWNRFFKESCKRPVIHLSQDSIILISGATD